MKKILLSLLGALAWGCAAYGQAAWSNDSVSMGTSTINDVYYSLSGGSALAKTENNKNWHLAFTMNAGDSSGIWVNHNAGNNFVKVWNIHRDTTQWNSVSLADTATGELLFNNDNGWYSGALNNKPGSSAFDFGWGKYDPITHNIIGDSIFIIRADGDYYKVWIRSLASTAMTYTFTLGHILSNMDSTFVIAKQPKYANNLFAHFDMSMGADTNREPVLDNWDLLLTRYTTNAPGSGPMPNNSVIGVLSNRGVKVAKAAPVHPDTAWNNYTTYIATWSPMISGVGYNWKTYDQGTNTWSVEDSTSYFVQDRAGNLWQMMFTAYSGSATGKVNFSKRMLAPVFVNEVASAVNHYTVFPNPAHTQVQVVIDAKTTTPVQFALTGLNGQVIRRFSAQLQSGLNAFTLPTDLPAGSYLLSVDGAAVRLREKIAVTH
jgi:hypothetical protein